MRNNTSYTSLFFSFLTVIAIIGVPFFARAASNDITFTSDTSFSIGGVTLTVLSGAEIAGFVVNSGSIDFNLESGSFAAVTSPDKYTLSNSQATTKCHGDYSYISLTSSATQTITVTPVTSRALCYGGSAGAVAAVTTETVETTTPTPEVVPETTQTIPSTSTSSLTESQIQAVILLLNSFGADTATVAVAEASLRGQTTSGTGPTGSVVSVTFTRDLTVGSTGADVKALQQFLNNNGYAVASSDLGSAGNETEYFGSLTKAAVIKYQIAKGISPAVGYFGPLTRTSVNSAGQ